MRLFALLIWFFAEQCFGSDYASMLRFWLRCHFPHYFKLSNVCSFIFGIFFGGRVATTCSDGRWSCGDYLASVRSNLIVYYDLKRSDHSRVATTGSRVATTRHTFGGRVATTTKTPCDRWSRGDHQKKWM